MTNMMRGGDDFEFVTGVAVLRRLLSLTQPDPRTAPDQLLSFMSVGFVIVTWCCCEFGLPAVYLKLTRFILQNWGR